jgi:hypothetical protein
MFVHCIGSVSFWASLLAEETVLLTTHHTFQKQSSLSQFEIATAQGRLKISVPTVKQTRKGLYKNVAIDYSSNWQIEMWRSIENSYQKSPFFQYYDYKIKSKILATETYLLDYNMAVLHVIADMLKQDTEMTVDAENSIYFSEISPVTCPRYPQVFDDKNEFQENLCVLDALFNLGPETFDYLLHIYK